MKAHIEKHKQKLTDLAVLADKTHRQEARILQKAEARMEEVQARIEQLRTGIEGAPDDEQDRYQDLIRERGHLNIVIARAKKELGV